MAQIQGGETFAIGQQFTATRANNHVNGAVLLPGAITDQPAIAANTVEATDAVLLHDASTSSLKEATVGDLLNSGLPATLENVVVNDSLTLKDTGGTSQFIIQAEGPSPATDPVTVKINGRSGFGVPQVIVGDLLVSAADITQPDVVIGGTMIGQGIAQFDERVDFATPSAIKLPVGTTGQRPSSPVTGDLRFNSTTTQAEIYNGTAWEEVGGGPFDATGGNTIIAPDTTVVSGVSFTSADGYRVTVTHSGHSVTPGQVIKFTTTVAGYSGEFTVYEAAATTFKFFMVTIATPNSGTGSYQKAGNFKCHIFTSSGTFVAGHKDGYVEVLVVGGGGGGGTEGGGGGGGLALVPRYKVNGNEIVSVTVGGGGNGNANLSLVSAGGSSIFGSVTAYGGGPGRNNFRGGISGNTSINPSFFDPPNNNYGGAGVGSNASFASNGGPVIGCGFSNSLTGITKNYSWGGVGQYFSGIAASNYPADIATQPSPNTGRGGNRAANGSSGIVIVRYPYWL